MRWKNKGHEYDIVFQNIKKKKAYYLFGAGTDGIIVSKLLKTVLNDSIDIIGFLDNDKCKTGTIVEGLRVFSFDEVKISDDIGIIISISPEVLCKITAQLDMMELVKNVDYFHYYEFISVFAVYSFEKIFIPSVSIIPTTKCNLCCEACLNFTHYMQEFKTKDIENLKKDIDLFFSVVDYVGVISVSGGDPLLYKDIGKMMRYLSENYQDRILSLEIVTNGTILPDKEFLSVCKDCSFTITIDDYCDTMPSNKERFDEVVRILSDDTHTAKAITRKYDEWIDLAPFGKYDGMNKDMLITKFNNCHVPWSEYRDGKLSLCNYASFAEAAGINSDIEQNEYYDLCGFDKSSAKELIEFRLGYSEKGYTNFCKRCAGYIEINPNKVVPGKQIQRINWKKPC